MENSPNKKFKIDFHTHSILSHDGGITIEGFRKILETGTLDFIAITDHNEIEFAQMAQKELGSKVIVGEEVSSLEGDVVGLFLTDLIPRGLSTCETVQEIKRQGGISYMPHPYDAIRSGVLEPTMDGCLDEVDVIEVFNARVPWRKWNTESANYALKHGKAVAASSDSHHFNEVGKTYTLINESPTRENLVKQLMKPEMVTQYISPLLFLNPKLNKMKKLFKKITYKK